MDERRTPRHDGPGPLGEILLGAGLLSREGLREALALQERHGGRLGHLLVDHSLVPEEALAEALSTQLGLPYMDVAAWELDPRVVALVPADACRHHRMLPLTVRGERLTLAMADPFDEVALRRVERATGLEVRPVLATGSALRARLDEVAADLARGWALREALAATRRREDTRERSPEPVRDAV